MVEIKIGVDVLDGEDQILLVGETRKAEIAFFVGLGDVVGCDGHRQRVEVVAVAGIESDISVLDRFLVGCIQDLSRNGESVDVVARREAIDIILE